MLRHAILSAAILLPVQAHAADFACRNDAAEIRCDAGACEVVKDSGFTPMGLTRRGRTLSICAYSGCWEGPILVRRSRGGIDLLYAEVRGTTPGVTSRGTLAVIYDARERTAQMRWQGFSNAMTCG